MLRVAALILPQSIVTDFGTITEIEQDFPMNKLAALFGIALGLAAGITLATAGPNTSSPHMIDASLNYSVE